MSYEEVKNEVFDILESHMGYKVDRENGMAYDKSGNPIPIDVILKNFNMRCNYALGRNGYGK